MAYEKELSALAGIALFGKSDLQTKLLSTLIAQQFNQGCDIITSQNDSIVTREGLLLIDCAAVAKSEIETLLGRIHTLEGKSVVALLNVKTDSNFEALVYWPMVKGIFFLDVDQEQLIRGIGELLGRGYWLPRRLMTELLEANRNAPVVRNRSVQLTRREEQILSHLAMAATNQQIADELYLSEHTVKTHLYNVYKKLSVKNRVEASMWAKQNLVLEGGAFG